MEAGDKAGEAVISGVRRPPMVGVACLDTVTVSFGLMVEVGKTVRGVGVVFDGWQAVRNAIRNIVWSRWITRLNQLEYLQMVFAAEDGLGNGKVDSCLSRSASGSWGDGLERGRRYRRVGRRHLDWGKGWARSRGGCWCG